MTTRIIIMEVPDTQTQDDIHMAITVWNSHKKHRKIKIIQQSSIIVGDR